MKHLFLTTSLSLASLVASALDQHAPQAGASATPACASELAGPDEVVVQVGPVELSRAELAQEVQRLIPENYFHARVPAGRQRELEAQALASLIEKTLVHLDAQQRGLPVSEQQVRTRFRETLDLAGPQYADLAEREFLDLLESFRPRVVRKLLIERNEARFEAALVPVSEADLRARFAELEGQLLSPERARFLHLLLEIAPSASAVEAEAVQRRMEELRAQLEQGTSFEHLAREHSDDIFAAVGGDMGFVTLESFVTPSLARAAFELADGETSEVLNSIFGCHLVRRVESQPRAALSFEQARADLALELVVQRRVEQHARWMEELERSYPVVTLIELSPASPADDGGHER